MIAELFPEGIVSVVATEAMWAGELFPEEEAAIARAVPKRRREFTAGRLCARAALAQLGVSPAPLLSNPDRTPRWPQGIVGSISHCAGYCATVVARCERWAGVGVDAEAAEPLSPALAARICQGSELEKLAGYTAPSGTNWEKLIFSAKESTYKCYYPLARTFLGFHDVEIEFSPETGRFTAWLVRDAAPAAAGARCFDGRFACDGERVFTGVALPAPETDPDSAPPPRPGTDQNKV